MNSVIPTLLVAEDDDNDFIFLEQALGSEKFGAQIRRVCDGAEAIDYLAGKDEFANRDVYPLPDLMVLDLKMPRRDGFEVLAWLRRSALADLPVAIFSSSQEPKDVENAYNLGARAYLVKPSSLLSYSGVVQTLQELLVNGCVRPLGAHEVRTYQQTFH